MVTNLMKIDYKKRDNILTNEIGVLRENKQRAFDDQKENLSKRNQLYSNQIFDKTIRLENCDWRDKYAFFECKSYNFCIFEKTKFGKSVALSEDDYIVVSGISFFYVKFNMCSFDNIIFDGCHFIGSEFENCSTQHGKIVFENCCFRFMEIEHNQKDFITKNICTEFLNCNISATFNNCLADNLIFDNCKLIFSKFHSCEMPGSIFDKCGFYSVKFINSNINKLSIKSTSNFELEFYNSKDINDIDNEIYVSLVKKNFVKNLKLNSNEAIECYRNIAKMYFTLSKLLSVNNINDDLAREYTYRYNYFSMKIKKDYWSKLIFTLSWILCGFGERMGRFFGWFLFFILSTTTLYLFGGICVGQDKVIKYCLIGGTPVSIKQFLADFLICLHFSIVTFSTVGYGDITPYGWSHLVSAIEIIFGIILVAIFTSITVKKLLK